MARRRVAKTVKRPGQVLSTDEVYKVLAVCGRGPCAKRNRALLYLLWRTGLRCNEALDLRAGDVDVATRTVLVRAGKGGKSRTVPMDAGIPAQLEPWMAARKKLGITRAPLFCTLKGKRISNNYVRELTARLGKLAGLEKRVHPHAFRHSFAFGLANEGAKVHEIQALMGHNSLEYTATYVAHLGAGDLFRVIDQRPRV